MSYIMTADEIRIAYEADEIVTKAEAQYEVDHDEVALDAAYDKAEAMCRAMNERYMAKCK